MFNMNRSIKSAIIVFRYVQYCYMLGSRIFIIFTLCMYVCFWVCEVSFVLT